MATPNFDDQFIRYSTLAFYLQEQDYFCYSCPFGGEYISIHPKRSNDY